jgi:ABC-type Fe3+/spermidine/putrescine transport system ATPase subunit
MNAGRIEQIGAPLELYDSPATCSSPASSARRR